MSNLILPILFIITLIFALIKRVKVYDEFTNGAKNALDLVISIFPYLVSIFVMTELFTASGLSCMLITAISPFFEFLGIPKEITQLVIIKPFSGSGSLALLSEIYKSYGVDSYIGRTASVVFGGSETVFYISAVYYAKVKNKNVKKPIFISLVAIFVSTLFASLICRII